MDAIRRRYLFDSFSQQIDTEGLSLGHASAKISSIQSTLHRLVAALLEKYRRLPNPESES